MTNLSIRTRCRIAGLILSGALLATPSLVSAFGPQSSTKAQEWGFDFVEEFDGLRDWNQSALGRIGNQYEDDNLARMPKLANGSTSAWGFFSSWDIDVSTHPWIGSASGGRQVWRGTKSAAIDLGDTGNGPSRLGLHFGGDGYKDFSLFYMVWIPANMFPTSYIPGGSTLRGLGVYSENTPYAYYNSWKFNTFNVECNSARCPDPYGLHHTIPHIKQYNYTPNGLYIQNENDGPEVGRALDAGDFTLNAFMGQWWGVEFRIRNNDADTAYTMDIWTYDQYGNSTHIMQGQTFPLVEAAHGGSWDVFWFGGNNSNTWEWGPTMQSHYYVDDFIVDAGSKGRIGPRYFNALGISAAPPAAPPTFSGTPITR